MKASRKRMTFKTPKKGAKTPTKGEDGAISGQKEALYEKENGNDAMDGAQHDKLSVVRYKQIVSEMNVKEEGLVESYRKENEYLRSLKADVLVYRKLVGFDIVESDGSYCVTYEAVSDGVTRHIRFVLTFEENSYVYKLVESRNIDLPDFLSEEIIFDECQIRTFFFKVMEAVITRKN